MAEIDSYVGTMIAGRYRIKRKLGAGGMGVVYAAEQEALGREVAVKLILANHVQNEQVAARFQREARVIAKLSHPHIVTIHDFGAMEDGGLFIVMELLLGLSLGDYVRRAGRMDWQRSLTIVREISAALEAAHGAGVIHRDLKPDNIMIGQPGSQNSATKVLDFGVAKLMGGQDGDNTLTQEGMVVGTPAYMPPEIVMEGDTGDERSDLYSLGLLWLEMLAGQKIRKGKTASALLVEAVNTPVPTIEQLCPEANVPKAMASILYSLLEKDVATRLQSAALLHESLKTVERSLENDMMSEGTEIFEPVNEDAVAALDPKQATETSSNVDSSIVDKTTETEAIALLPQTRKRSWPMPVGIGACLLAMVGVAIWMPSLSDQSKIAQESSVGAASKDKASGEMVQTSAKEIESGLETASLPTSDPAPKPTPISGPAPNPASSSSKVASTADLDKTGAPPPEAPVDISDRPSKRKATSLRTSKKTTRKPKIKRKRNLKRKATRQEVKVLTSEDIEEAIVKNLGPASKCFNTNITRPRKGTGLLVDHCPSYQSSDVPQRIYLTIKPDGSITKARFKSKATAQTKIGKCILTSVKGWKFPKFTSQDSVTVSQKIAFKPCIPINNKCVFRRR
jgi:serine/threonine protein kinase